MLNFLKHRFERTTLRKKIIIVITVVASLVPTVLISTLAFTYYKLGIEALFNEKISTAISSTVYVAEAYLQEHKKNITSDVLSIASDIERNLPILMEDEHNFVLFLDKQAELRKLSEVYVFRKDELIAKNSFSLSMLFERVPDQDLKKAESGEVVMIDVTEEKVRALIKLHNFFGDTYLMVGKFVDPSIIEHLSNTKGSADQYQIMLHEIKATQTRLELMLILVSILTCAGSIMLGIRLSKVIILPINKLVEATELITKGDYSIKVAEKNGKDETTILIRAFNHMITTISDQREKVLNYNRIINERRRFIEAVLSEISAGVLTINSNGKITLYNSSAAKLLSIKRSEKLYDFTHFLPEISELIDSVKENPQTVLSNNIEIIRDSCKSYFFVRIGAQLNEEGVIDNLIVTFDDITELVAAQRSAAWADVARRIAHEIKNPLTPIQLSAERIKHKYFDQISSEKDNFSKYIETIIKHVSDIERIVEEFISFARIPAPVLKKNDICKIINDTLFEQRYVFKKIKYSFDSDVPSCYVYCDSSQISQVLLNILKNAGESIDARQKNSEDDYQGAINISLTYNKEGFVQIEINDNGQGIEPTMIDRIFEPYVTTKVKGTGLGLSIVKKIIEDHGGQIFIKRSPEGVSVLLTLELYQIKEA